MPALVRHRHRHRQVDEPEVVSLAYDAGQRFSPLQLRVFLFDLIGCCHGSAITFSLSTFFRRSSFLKYVSLNFN